MSIILSLEDSEGKPFDILIEENDDFKTFINKVKARLKTDFDLSAITGNKKVNLSDNIFTFLSEYNYQNDDNEQESTEKELGEEKKVDDEKESGLNLVYVLDDGTEMVGSQKNLQQITEDLHIKEDVKSMETKSVKRKKKMVESTENDQQKEVHTRKNKDCDNDVWIIVVEDGDKLNLKFKSEYGVEESSQNVINTSSEDIRLRFESENEEMSMTDDENLKIEHEKGGKKCVTKVARIKQNTKILKETVTLKRERQSIVKNEKGGKNTVVKLSNKEKNKSQNVSKTNFNIKVIIPDIMKMVSSKNIKRTETSNYETRKIVSTKTKKRYSKNTGATCVKKRKIVESKPKNTRESNQVEETSNSKVDSELSEDDEDSWSDIYIEGKNIQDLYIDRKASLNSAAPETKSFEGAFIKSIDTKQSELNPRTFQCGTCKKRYSSSLRLTRHQCLGICAVSSEGQHQCKICSEKFLSKARHQFHMRFIHLGKGTLTCFLCPELFFPSESALYDHMNYVHQTSELHHCYVKGCGKSFKRRGLLTTHSKVHTNNRKHKCPDCTKTFLDKQTLREHSVTHMKNKPYQCPVCHKFLNRRSRFRMHVLSHEAELIPAEVLTCKLCEAAFMNAQQATEHFQEAGPCQLVDLIDDAQNNDDEENVEKLMEKIHKEVKPNEDASDDIKDSKLGIIDGEKVEDVMKNVSQDVKVAICVKNLDKVFRCEYCEKLYCTADALTLHRHCHMDVEDPFSCNICGASFSSYSRVTTHKTAHGLYRGRKNKTPISLPKFPVVKHFLCQYCNKSYLHWTNIQVHKRQKHLKNPYIYKCNICGEEFANSWGIAYHRKKMHSDLIENAERKNRSNDDAFNKVEDHLFQCPNCEKTCNTLASFKTHMKKDHNPKVSHKCDVCNKTFVKAASVLLHKKRLHSRELNFECEKCFKRFSSAGDLAKHDKIHYEKKTFNCEVCGNMFRVQSVLREHMRIHTDERPFTCDKCDASFRRCDALKKHRLTHDPDRQSARSRKTPCPHCHCQFKYQQDLGTHLKVKHGMLLSENKNKDIDHNYDKSKQLRDAVEEACEILHMEEGNIADGDEVSGQQESPEPSQMVTVYLLDDDNNLILGT